MSQRSPHISIDPSRLVTRVLGVSQGELATWPEDVQELAAQLAGEMFLVRYNPFIDSDLVRKSVAGGFSRAKHALSPDYEAILSLGMARFWKEYDEDQAFRRELVAKLGLVMPAECVFDSPASLVENSTDATDLRMELPLLVLAPETTAQIQGIVRLANEMGFSIIPRGGGTGLTGGAIPASLRTVILSLTRLKEIQFIDPERMIMCAQAGVLTLNAIKAAAEQGLLFTVDPASKAGSSLGGNISENSGGPFAFEYGTTLDNIYCFKMVLPSGELIEVRRKDHPRHKILAGEAAVFEILDESGKVKDTVTLGGDEIRAPGLGKDVSNKFLGGLPGVQKEGVDGIITETCFILYPQPVHSRVLCLEFFGRTMHNATLVIRDIVGLRDAIRRDGDLVKISALEEFGIKYVQAIEYKKKSSQYEGEPISVLIVQLDSDDEAALDGAVRSIVDIAKPYDNVDIFVARDEREGEVFWEDRHKLSAIARRTSGFKINEDVVIPLDRVPDFSDYLEKQNVYYLARAYRSALRQVHELTGISPDDEFITMEIAFATQLMQRTAPGPILNDDELQIQTHYFFQDLRSRYPKMDKELTAIYDAMLRTRVVIANHMHAGDGNCHVNLPVNSNDPEMLSQVHEAVERIFAQVLELGGGISGEHGIGITKIAFLPEEKIKALKEYKRTIDPTNILNPAKLTRREPIVEPYTFSFNRLIRDLQKTALKDKERLIHLLTNIQVCTRCGKCKQVCPMYFPQRGLVHYPRNKNISLGALVEAIYYSQLQTGAPAKPLLVDLQKLVDHCTGCGKCKGVCPVKIDTADVTLHLRTFLEEKGAGGHPLKSRILHFLADDPAKRLPMAAKAVSLGGTAQQSGIGLIPLPWRNKVDNPLFRGPGPRTGYKNLAETLHLDKGSIFVPAEGFTGETAFYFPGCGASLFYRSIGLASLYLLLKQGVAVVLPEEHQCCGYPLLVSGCESAYENNRKRNLDSLRALFAKAESSHLPISRVLTSCGTCRDSLSRFDLPAELKQELEHQDMVQFLIGRLRSGGFRVEPGKVPPQLLYHASCHAEWVGVPSAKAAEMYRAALVEMLGTKVRITPGCCGESGLGALTSPGIYNRIRERKQIQLTHDLKEYDAKSPILVGCPSCKVGLKRSMIDMGREHPVLHTVEFLAELVGGQKWKSEIKRSAKERRKNGVRKLDV